MNKQKPNIDDLKLKQKEYERRLRNRRIASVMYKISVLRAEREARLCDFYVESFEEEQYNRPDSEVQRLIENYINKIGDRCDPVCNDRPFPTASGFVFTGIRKIKKEDLVPIDVWMKSIQRRKARQLQKSVK